MRSGVIFGEDAGAVVGGEDEDGIDRKEGHVGRHCSGGERDAEGKGGEGGERSQKWEGEDVLLIVVSSDGWLPSIVVLSQNNKV